ncbi:MAG TPA: AMP-binding protein [Candidatus Angelobacter sp.]|jgi:fatty-acyl-CoA synthase|nr:AMP-binding protein [Candidatus Angelobacter sp.]
MATPAPQPILSSLLGDVLSRQAEQYPDKDALIYPELGLRWSFRQLEELAQRCARGLAELGIEKGERVAIWSTNLPEWVVLFFGLAKIGAAMVTVNTLLRKHEVEYLLGQSESCTLILSQGFRDVDYPEVIYQIVPELRSRVCGTKLSCAKLPRLRHVIFLGENAPAGMMPYAQIQELGTSAPADILSNIRLDVHEVINIQYTSGTTGFPKGAMLSHHNIVHNGYWIGHTQRFTAQDRLCLPVPFFHCFGCVLGILGAYTWGAAIVPLTSFDPEKALHAVASERCTVLYGVPTMYIAELEHPSFGKYDLSSLRTGIMSGAPCPESLMRRVIRDMHMPEITIAYGLTEASPVVTMTEIDDDMARRTQTVGKPLPGAEVKIVDAATGEPLPPNQIGELWVRGYLVMKGYYNKPEATQEAITPDGWLRTGDLASQDESGYIAIRGRKKEMIIRGGENVYPREVEDFLRSHPKISDAAVYGVPHHKFGEEVAAAIRLKDGESSTPEEIIAYCKGQIASFKIPKHIQFVSEFPQTASGKLQKYKLRERALQDFPSLQAAAEVSK